jgi:hypothetical protein
MVDGCGVHQRELATFKRRQAGQNASHSIVDDAFEIKENPSRGVRQNRVLPLIRASLSM